MLEVLNEGKTILRKHPSRGKPAKLNNADRLLLLLMYYREYRIQFHIGVTYGISESRVCEIIKEVVKIFRIIAEKYRNRRKRFALKFNLIAAIYNLNLNYK